MKKRMPCLCLDVDGTVRRSKSGKTFISGPDDIEIIPGIADKILDYKDKGYFVFLISNQGGVAHGFRTEDQIREEMRRTLRLLAPHRHNPAGRIDCAYWCPAMEDGNVADYAYRSLLRKPQIGMLVRAELDADAKGIILDWPNSLMVGDRSEDEACAKNAGIAYKHIDTFLAEP